MTLTPDRYRALLIANWIFPSEAKLAELHGPPTDIEFLKESLTNPDSGLFATESVQEITNGTHAEISNAIGRFLHESKKADLLLLYYSGHGVPDQGRVRLCAKDTTIQYGSFLSIDAADILQEIERSPASVVVVILDCCFSARFGKGKDRVSLERLLPDLPEMRGVFLLASGQSVTADAIEAGQPSPFTQFIAEALTSGELDENHDGYTSFNDVYMYVYRRFREEKLEPRPVRRVTAEGGDPVLARAREPAPVSEAETPLRPPPLARWQRNTAIVLLAAAIVTAAVILFNAYGLKQSPPQHLATTTPPPPAAGSVDLSSNTAWNLLGVALPVIIQGKQVNGGILVPITGKAVSLTLTIHGSVRSVSLPVGLTQQSMPGTSVIAVRDAANPTIETHTKLQPNSIGQLNLTGLKSQKITFDLTSTVNCCQTAYLGDVTVTDTHGKVVVVGIESDLETSNSTILESTSANPSAVTEGVSGGMPFSDAIILTLDSAGQDYQEQRFGLGNKPLSRFSTTILVEGKGADPVKAVTVFIYANSDVVAGPIILKAGQSHYVNVSLGGTPILRLVAQGPQDSCCYQVDFGDPTLSASS